MGNKSIKKVLAFALAVAICLSLAPVSFAAEANLQGQVVILHTNDSHGRISDGVGFAGVKALKDDYLSRGATVLLLDAGDTLHGKPVVNVEQGKNAAQLLADVGYDAMALGNHDFNYGYRRILQLSNSVKGMPTVLASNVVYKENGNDMVSSAKLFQRGGKKIGVFALSSPETVYKTNPKNTVGLEFLDPIATAKKEVKILKERYGAEIIVGLFHIGLDKATKITSDMIAKEVPGIDVIIDGHSHTTLEKGMVVENTLIASTGSYMENVGVVQIDSKGNKSASLVSGESYKTKDAAIAAEIEAMSAVVDEKLNVVIGKTTVELDGVRENVRASETNLGNLITDAMISATSADIALLNGGGIRASIPAGNISMKQVLEVLPFGNYVVVKKLTGKEIVAALEKGVADYPEPAGGFPHVAGIQFRIDPTAPAGSRVKDAMVGGKALDEKAQYNIAINDFMAAGGDDYTMFVGKPTLGEYPGLDEVVVSFLKKSPDYVAKKSGRIVVGADAATLKVAA